MKVYVLEYCTYDYNHIVGVYATRALAEKAQADHWAIEESKISLSDRLYFMPEYDTTERELTH